MIIELLIIIISITSWEMIKLLVKRLYCDNIKKQVR